MGQSWGLLERGLAQWHLDMRLSEIYPPPEVYVAQEVLANDSDLLKAECIDRGTTFDDARWLNNRNALDDFLVADHLPNLLAERAALAPAPAPAPVPPPPVWQAVAPSHASGLGPWIPTTGMFRTHYAFRRVGAPADEAIPADATGFFGVTLLRIQDLVSTDVGWQGLTTVPTPYMISSCVAGISDTIKPGENIVLEGFELVQPFRLFGLALDVLANAPSVTSAEEAWQAFKADNTSRLFIFNGLPLVDLGDHLSWSGNVVNDAGKSVLSTLDMSAGAPPGYAGLAASLGVKSDTTFFQQRSILATGFGQASLEASFNQLAPSKGHAHDPIAAVAPAALSRDINPVDGNSFPLHIPATDRLKQVTRLASQALPLSLLPCQCAWWCDICNAMLIMEIAAKEGLTWQDIKTGNFKFTPAMLAVIRPIDVDAGEDATFCNCSGTRRKAQPPFGSTLLCPTTGCGRWLHTPADLLCQGCHKCGFKFGAELPKSAIPDLGNSTSIVTIENQIDAHRFAYIRMRGGPCALESGGQRQISSLAAARVALNAARARPEAFEAAITFTISERIICWLPIWKWDRLGIDGLCLWDFVAAFVRARPAFSVEALNKIAKACSSGKHPPPACPEPFPLEPEITSSMSSEEAEEAWDQYWAENVKFNRLLIDLFENACIAMVFGTSEEYRPDVATAVAVAKDEFLHHSSLEDAEWWIVYETLMCCLQDVSRRLDLQCRHTTSVQTTDYEKKSGGTIRFLPSLSCETVVRNVYLPLERAQRSIGRKAIKSQFPIGAAADQQLRERKAARQKATADSKKKAEQAAQKKAQKEADKAKKVKEDEKNKRDQKKKQADKRKSKEAAQAAKAEDDAKADAKADKDAKSKAAKAAHDRGKAAADEAAKKVKLPPGGRSRGDPSARGGRGRGKGKGGREGRAGGSSPDSSPAPADADQDPACESEAELSEAEAESEGDLYADGYTDGDVTDEGYSSGKKSPPACTRHEKRHGCDAPKPCSCKVKAAANLPLTTGGVHGDIPIPLEAKLLDSLPRILVDDKQVCVCWRFNTALGCQQPYCSCAHVLLPTTSFSAAWHLLFLTHHGHHSLNGSISKKLILNLLTDAQQEQLMGHSEAAQDKLLYFHLANRLGALVHPTNEPIETLPVQSGETHISRTRLWDCTSSPFAIGTPSNMGAAEISRVIVGCCDAVFSGLLYDTGQIIHTAAGQHVDNMCQIKAVAAMLPGHHLSPPAPTLAKEMYSGLAAIDPHSIPTDSRLALLYTMCSRAAQRGFPDSLWTLAQSKLADRAHVCSICLDAGPLNYKLNLVHTRVGRFGEMDYNASNWEQLQKRAFSTEALMTPVVFVVNSASEGQNASRHAEGLALTKGCSLLQVVSKLAHFAATGKGRVTLSERNCHDKLAKAKSPVTISRSNILRAYMEIKRVDGMFKQRPPPTSVEGLAGSTLTDPPQLLSSEEVSEAVAPSLAQAIQEHRVHVAELREGFSGRSARASHATVFPPKHSPPPPSPEGPDSDLATELEFQGWTIGDWKQWHDSLEIGKLTTHADFAKAYCDHYLLFLKEEDPTLLGASGRSVLFSSQFFNRWIWVAVHKWKQPEKTALLDILASLRSHLFGDQRQSLGPDPDLIHEVFKGALSHGHLKLVDELVRNGGDPICLDLLNGEGFFNRNAYDSPEVLLKLLQDQVTELQALRGIVFDTRHRQVKRILLKAGVHVSSTVLAPKMAPHGGQVQKNGEDVFRMCTDCTGGPFAPNLTVHSADHTRQKTTTTHTVSHKILQEERRHPDHPVRLVKDDICHAFRQVATALRRVSKFATHAGPFVLIHLTMIFGSSASPGLFEPLGDAVVKGLAFSPRSSKANLSLLNTIGETIKLPSSWQELSAAGDLHPEVCRFVDDVLSIIAMMGTRCADHLQRLRGLIVSLLGPGGLNLTKQGEEGLPSNFKHTFGVVVDCVRRIMMAPWSKIVKLTNLARDYANGKQATLTLSEVEKIRGVAQHVYLCAPGLARMLLPRLDAALSHAHRLHPGGSHPPPHCKPSPSLAGETAEEGHDRLRKVLNFVLRLSLIGKGKLLQSSFEAMLPREVRTTWPGQEDSSSLVHFLMDASKNALFLIDLRTGRYIQTDLTDSEKALFNRFEEGTAATTINHWELLSELFGIVILGPQHFSCIIDMINDNTAAENWTKKNRHKHAKVDQVLSIIGLSELLLKQTVVGSRVRTKENFADTGTRMKTRSQDFLKGLQELEVKYGWTARQVKIPPWLRSMGWDALSKDLPPKEWWTIAIAFVTDVESKHPGLIGRQCGVDASVILQELEKASSLDPLPGDLVPDRDFPAPSKSKIRQESTCSVPPTSTQLYRSLDSYCKRFGPEQGPSKFCLANEAPADADPHRIIETILQHQHRWYYDLVRVENQEYDPSFIRPSPPAPAPLKLSDKQRQAAPVTLASVFTGSGAGEEALRASDCGYTVMVAEQQPTLLQHLKARLPQDAIALRSASDFLEQAKPRCAQMLQSSPPCPSHSTANLYRQGNLDLFGGLHWQDSALYILKILAANVWLECTSGVLRSTKGHPSPMTLLKKAVGQLYWVSTLVIDAGKTASPATGRVSPLCHSRVHVLLWKKSCYPVKPKVEHLVNQATPLSAYREFMNTSVEGKEYRAMPDEDFASMSFGTAPNSAHATVLAEVFEPEEGRGHYLWPNLLEDPNTGRLSVLTASSGSKWVCRSLNGKAQATRLTNTEGFRMYCADGRCDHPSLLADDSQLGQSVIGNMIPVNVADWVMYLMLGEYFKVQSDGWTAQEKWLKDDKIDADLAQYEATASGKKRAFPDITPAVNAEVENCIKAVACSGKKPKTVKAYSGAVGHWIDVCLAKGWSPLLDQESPRERTDKFLWYFAYERSQHNLKASSIRSKRSAIRWFHLQERHENPFKDLEAVDQWLADLKKVDGPSEPKLPVPVSLLRTLFCFLKTDPKFASDPLHYHHTCIKGAVLTGFWFLLRSIEYLAEDGGNFDPDRSLTWANITPYLNGKILPLHRLSEADQISITIYSGKNDLETYTRSLHRVPGSDVCVVDAIAMVYAAHRKKFGTCPKPRDAVFKKNLIQALTRAEISDYLKLVAHGSGIPHGRVASHSLRRGDFHHL